MCSQFSVCTLFSLILENMSTNVRKFLGFLVMFDTCDVVYNLSISHCHLLYSIIYLGILRSTC